MKFYLSMLTLLFFSFAAIAEEKSGPIVLVGGGNIPNEAIKWMKSKSKSDKFVIVTLNKDRCERWKEFFGDPELFYPDELKKSDGIGGLVIDGGDQWQYVNKLNGKFYIGQRKGEFTKNYNRGENYGTKIRCYFSY